MSSDLRNALATFQRTLDTILSKVNLHFGIVYMENIVIFSNNPEQHIDHVFKVHLLLYNDKATFKLEKCNLLTIKTNHLGHAIRSRRLELVSNTMDAIRELKLVISLTKLMSL